MKQPRNSSAADPGQERVWALAEEPQPKSHDCGRTVTVGANARLCEEEEELGISAAGELSRAADLSSGRSRSGDVCCMPEHSC